MRDTLDVVLTSLMLFISGFYWLQQFYVVLKEKTCYGDNLYSKINTLASAKDLEDYGAEKY